MADLVDMSEGAASAFDAEALSKRVRFEGVARVECLECGLLIEAERRRLLGGRCVHCADCAAYFEAKNKLNGRS